MWPEFPYMTRLGLCNFIVCYNMDNTQVCSRCKKVATRARGISIHKTLAYTRCRCHRFSKKHQDSMAQVSSILNNIPEQKPDLSTGLQGVLGTSRLSPSTHGVRHRQSISTISDQQINLPRILERPSLVADRSTVAPVVATGLCGNGCRNVDTQVTKGAQVNVQSATTPEKSTLPRLSLLPQTRCVICNIDV